MEGVDLRLREAYSPWMSVIRSYGICFLFAVATGGCGSGGGPAAAPPVAELPEPPQADPTPAPTAEAPALPTAAPAVARPAPEPTRLDPALVPWRDALASARTRQIERLAAYRKAREFPSNHIALGRIPIFVDTSGAHCAVAYLMRESGHGDLVETIARTNNFVRIEEVTSGPLIDWILLSGLTREEAALIQPGYSWASLEGGARETELSRLESHFIQVEALLVRTTEDSLALALERVQPMIAAGKTPADVVR